MQNSFEKQVQEKMDELRFAPAEPVWQNIEKQIRIKKERRRLILWLPFLFLLLSGGAWWFTTQTYNAGRTATAEKNSETGIRPFDKKQNTQPAANDHNPAGKEKAVAGNTVQKDQQVPLKAAPGLQPATRIDNTTSVVKQKKQNLPSILTPPSFLSEKQGTQKEEKAAINDKVNKVDNKANENVNAISSSKIDSAINKTNAKKDSAVLYKITEVKTDSANTAVAETPKISTPKTAKWQFGILADAGVSGIAKNIGSFISSFGEEKALMMDASSSPGNGLPAPVYGPSPVKNNLSFSAGIVARRKLTKRIAVSTGLHYRYYSTRIAVGQMRRQDTTVYNSGFTQSVSRFYLNSGNSFNDYQNRYHFIGIPLSVDWNVLKKAPLRLHAGVSVQRLISSNALIFDKGSRIYYTDQNAINRTQVFSSLALSYAVFEGSKTSLLVGPQLQYGISDLEKNAADKHLFSLGLTAQLLLNKN
jgi:hypothetical protein